MAFLFCNYTFKKTTNFSLPPPASYFLSIKKRCEKEVKNDKWQKLKVLNFTI